MRIYDRLKQIRDQHGWAIEDIAERMGIEYIRFAENIEYGEYLGTDDDFIAKLARAYEIPFEQFKGFVSDERIRQRHLKQILYDAIWQGEIDGLDTNEVIMNYGGTTGKVRYILLNLIDGVSGDSRFVHSNEPYGAIISTGQIFSGRQLSNRHYIWELVSK